MSCDSLGDSSRKQSKELQGIPVKKVAQQHGQQAVQQWQQQCLGVLLGVVQVTKSHRGQLRSMRCNINAAGTLVLLV
jgi:hypothetical protein